MRILIALACLSASCCQAVASGSQVATRVYADDKSRVHIVEAGGRDVLVRAEKGQAGVDKIQVAADGKTVGWLVNKWGSCCVSYPIPTEIVVWRAGRILRRIDTGRAAWSWTFLEDGRRLAYRDSFLHGGWSGESVLIETATGRTLASWEHPMDANGNDTDDDTGEPAWARQLQ